MAGAAHRHGAEVVVVKFAAEVHWVHGVDRATVSGAVLLGEVSVDASRLGWQYGLLSGGRPVWLPVAATSAGTTQIVRTEIDVVVYSAKPWIAAIRVAAVFERVLQANICAVARLVHLHLLWRGDCKACCVHRQPRVVEALGEVGAGALRVCSELLGNHQVVRRVRLGDQKDVVIYMPPGQGGSVAPAGSSSCGDAVGGDAVLAGREGSDRGLHVI